MSIYYHFHAIPLEAGSIILPGNWGRMLETYTTADINYILAREQTYEMVRLQSFNHLPSRLNCVFLFEDINSALNSYHHFPRCLLSEIELVDPSQPIHKGDMGLADSPNSPTPYKKAIEDRAQGFWSGNNITGSVMEVITSSPVRIVRTLHKSHFHMLGLA
ncbi:DUF2441 domain-containing protein [Lelliottia nimipressuralis]|uniref:DUF2441 domain-containing protein n=1 Tax=Lelliottia nimipressuralis TaxID=69220 RepID=UPI003D2AFFAB